ncbi:hypothetical protein QTH90_31390 [Variovorax sp. J2P1-59]|uniref:hypothetical protein n=1 Tax=Variovorax flavidus TaxID=3053501 RepID=UPI0025756EA3|nr:hypothetical protein [Variovorax sp. J2P1-59]MDM0078945.1 hypothetical protein [Variovorax sp. J2P1-59]
MATGDVGAGFDPRVCEPLQVAAYELVRSDHYVSNVLPPDAKDELAAFFGTFLLDRQQARR